MDSDTARPAQRRRLDVDSLPQPTAIPDWNKLYTIEPITGSSFDSLESSKLRLTPIDEELPETTNELGQLSLDDNQEVHSARHPVQSQLIPFRFGSLESKVGYTY